MNTREVAEKVKSMVLEDFGVSFSELKEKIKKTYDPCLGYDSFESTRGYSIFYTDNSNFEQGIKNGGGVGFYARLSGVGTYRTIKLE